MAAALSASTTIEELLPLKAAQLEILLALLSGTRHGYAIRREAEARTGGKVRLWPTTLYGTIAQLLNANLIEEVASAQPPKDDVPRKFYQITPFGRRVVAAEADRLREIVRIAEAATTKHA